MTETEKLNAGKAQTQIYLLCQFPKWRLFSVLTIKKIMEEYSMFDKILAENKFNEYNHDYYPQRQYYSGLMLQALSESIQCIEDLFALIFCAQNIPMFVNRITNYKAGRITHFIEFVKFDVNNISKLFFLRFSLDEKKYKDKEMFNFIHQKTQKLMEDLGKLQAYYIDNEYLYIQYKHGQSLIYQPDGEVNQSMTRDEIIKGFQVFPFDNIEIKNALRQSRSKLGISLFSSEYTEKHLNELDRQTNLLRFIIGSEDMNIRKIERITRICTNIYEALRNNIIEYCQIPEKHPVVTCFPSEKYEGFSTFTEATT